MTSMTVNPVDATADRENSKKIILRLDRAAIVLVLLIPSLLCLRTIGVGVDDEAYLQYFANASSLLELGIQSPITFAINEPLFLVYSVMLDDPELTLRATIFLGALLAGIGVGRLSQWSFSSVALYFIFPQSLVLHVDHLRQGFAVGIYFFFLSCRGRVCWLRMLAPLIHSSFWIVLGIEFVCRFFFERNREVATVWHIFALTIGVAFSVFFALAFGWLASSIGLRQADAYDYVQIEGSGLGLMFWVAAMPIAIMAARTWFHAYFCVFLGFYIGGYFLNPLAARMFGDSYPLMLSNPKYRPWGHLLNLSLLVYAALLMVMDNYYARLFA